MPENNKPEAPPTEVIATETPAASEPTALENTDVDVLDEVDEKTPGPLLDESEDTASPLDAIQQARETQLADVRTLVAGQASAIEIAADMMREAAIRVLNDPEGPHKNAQRVATDLIHGTEHSVEGYKALAAAYLDIVQALTGQS